MNQEEKNISRREFLAGGMAGLGALGLVGAFPGLHGVVNPKKGKAKSVIQIWMWGGPSHIDTFDPKPEAGPNYCGSLTETIETNVKGIRIGQKLPMLAKLADKYAIIRGMTHGDNGHETASYMVQTGRRPGTRLVYPGAGAVVSMLCGYNTGYKGLIPPYVVLTQPQGRFSEAGFLGQRYKPFATGGNPQQKTFHVEGILSPYITRQEQIDRRGLLKELDVFGRLMKNSLVLAAADGALDKAYELVLGKAGEVFDLSKVKEKTRERYGMTKFGQSCLVAKKLVDYGVPYITINYNGWDTHKKHFETMNWKLPEMDRGMSALIEDLSASGQLDETIIWWTGEFGRGPKVQWEAPWNGGRSHYGAAFSAVLAGGGFKGGQVVGATNKTAEKVIERPVYPWDMIGSIYQMMGIDPDSSVRHPDGFSVRLTEAEKNTRHHSKGRLTEIM